MLPLVMTRSGEKVFVTRIGGNDEAKRHLADLGFVVGTEVTAVQSHNGDMIVKVKDSTLAITREMAQKIMVQDVPPEK